jgi:hypothetical protein
MTCRLNRNFIWQVWLGIGYLKKIREDKKFTSEITAAKLLRLLKQEKYLFPSIKTAT